MSCNHEWKTYTGLFEVFDYCKCCNIKRVDSKSPQAFLDVIKKAIAPSSAMLFVATIPTTFGRGLFSGTHTHSIRFHVHGDSKLTISDWLPIERPKKGELFYGVERYLDDTRLAGIVHRPNSTLAFEEQIYDCLHLVAREGGRTDYIFAPIGVPIKKLNTPYGAFEIKECLELKDEMYFIQSDTWTAYPNTLVCSVPGFNLRALLK